MPNLIEGGNNMVRLVKRSISDGTYSGIPEGIVIKGTPAHPIKIGEPIEFFEGGRTTPLRGIVQDSKGRKFYITLTSRYEELDDDFSGLSLTHELGSVKVPADTQPAKIGNGEVYIDCQPRKDYEYPSVYINKDALSPVLLETLGAQLFRGMHDRLFVLARVGNIHLPYYRSKSGTDGKNQGDWYPFFGYTGEWAVKGPIDKDGSMNYHPKIDEVTRLLNQNLRIPFIDSRGGLVGGLKELVPDFNINDHLTYINSEICFPTTRQQEVVFVEQVTGYEVSSRITPYENGPLWMSQVVRAISSPAL